MDNLINLKLTIDGREANATIDLTDANIRDLYKSFKYGQAEVNGLTTAISRGFNNAREIIGGVRESFGVLQGMFSAPIQAAAQFESFRVQFEVLLGDATVAKERINELAEFAAKTPFQLPEVVDASRQLEVLTKGALATGEGLRMVGDVAAGTGVRINEIAMWFGRLYDNIQSGRPVGEALMRLQELGAVSGETRGELEKLQKENRMQAEGWDIVTKAMERFGGMMDKQAETLGGKLSNLEDNFGQVKVAIGGVVALGLSPMLDGMNSLIGALHSFSPVLVGSIGTIGLLGGSLTMLKVTGIGPVVMSLMTMKLSLGAATVGMTGFSGAVAAASTAVKGFFASLGPIGWVTIVLGALASAYMLVAGNTKKATDEAKDFSSTLKNMGMTELTGEMTRLNGELERMQNELLRIYGTRGTFFEKEQKLRQIENVQWRINQITEEIRKKEAEITAQKARQYETVRARLNLQVAGGEMKAALEAAKQDYEEQKKVLDAYHSNLTDLQKYAHKDFIDLEKAYNRKKAEIRKEYADKEREEKFTIEQRELLDEREHNIKMAELKGASAEEIYNMEVIYLSRQIELRKKYNKSILDLERELIEKNAELHAKKEEEKKKDAEAQNAKDAMGTGAPTEAAQSPGKLTDLDIKRMKIENMPDGYDKQMALNDFELEFWQKQYEGYEGFTEAKILMDEKHANRKKKIEGDSMQASLQMMGDLLAEHTAFGKAVAIANAYMNTYAGATKALEIGGPFGIPLMATVIAAGMAQVANIMDVEIPKLATGGVVTRPTTALIGEAGPEAIIPLNRYNFSSGDLNTRRLENLIEHHVQSIENTFRRIEFRIKSGDLYGVVAKETKRRKSFK